MQYYKESLFDDALSEQSLDIIHGNFYAEQSFGSHGVFISSTINNQIQTLSELFNEWFLFDSSESKDLSTFIKSEGIDDIFTSEQFMDLVCGNAYLDERLITFIHEKLPFNVTTNKIEYLNYIASRDKKFPYCIEISEDIINQKTRQILSIKQQKRKEKQREYYLKNQEYFVALSRKYRQENAAIIKERKKIYRANNLDKIRAQQEKYKTDHSEDIRQYNKEYRETNRERLLQYEKRYRENNADVISERKKKSYSKKKAQYNAQNKKNYEENKEYYRAKHKEYYEKNKEKLSESAKQRYQNNKERIKTKTNAYRLKHLDDERARSRARYSATKECNKNAMAVCPAYLYLLSLRKQDLKLYLTIYKKQEDIIGQAKKQCTALQNMDYKLCSFYTKIDTDEQMKEKCPMPKVFILPQSFDFVRKFATSLKQK